eukprot:6779160-Heterocapsa_arctica.AAC.1
MVDISAMAGFGITLVGVMTDVVLVIPIFKLFHMKDDAFEAYPNDTSWAIHFAQNVFEGKAATAASRLAGWSLEAGTR